MKRCFCLVLLLSACTPSVDIELDLTTPGTFSVVDDGTTLVATACPGGQFLGCVVTEQTTVSLAVDGTNIPLPFVPDLFAPAPYTATIPSPAGRDAEFWYESPDATEGPLGDTVEVQLLPAFATTIAIPVSRAEPLRVDVERLPDARVGHELTTTCAPGSESYSIHDDDSLVVPLDGQGTCEHEYVITQTVTRADDYIVHSSRVLRMAFTTTP